jgi:hypothetical protein
MYKLLNPIKPDEISRCILRIVDNTFIPFNPDNTDYQQYLIWLSQGNTPTPAANT